LFGFFNAKPKNKNVKIINIGVGMEIGIVRGENLEFFKIITLSHFLFFSLFCVMQFKIVKPIHQPEKKNQTS
jgi:hypothetical protein